MPRLSITPFPSLDQHVEFRTLQRPRKTDTLCTIALRHAGEQGHLVNLCFVPTGEFDAEAVANPLVGNSALAPAVGKRSVKPDDDPHYVLEVVDVNKQTYRNIKIRTATKQEKTIIETGPVQIYSLQSASAGRIQKILSVCELANGDVACLSEDGRIIMLEVNQPSLDLQLAKWKSLMGLNDNAINNPEKPLIMTFEYDGKKEVHRVRLLIITRLNVENRPATQSMVR